MKKMEMKDVLKMSFNRFWRVIIPQAVLFVPLLITLAEDLKEILPVWVIPALVTIASIATALDKFRREVIKLKK